jgi:hypothetical protein
MIIIIIMIIIIDSNNNRDVNVIGWCNEDYDG